jgi:hypothetical protein
LASSAAAQKFPKKHSSLHPLLTGMISFGASSPAAGSADGWSEVVEER